MTNEPRYPGLDCCGERERLRTDFSLAIAQADKLLDDLEQGLHPDDDAVRAWRKKWAPGIGSMWRGPTFPHRRFGDSEC